MARPIQFQEANMVWKGWPADSERTEVLDLPAYRSSAGQTISCWKLSWRERLHMLFYGVVWLYVYGQQPPVSIGGIKPFEKEGKENARQEENTPSALRA